MTREFTLHFRKAGLQTTVQDLGRPGYQAQGVPVGGALDQTAARVANWLVGNAPGAPVLEITYSGPELTIGGACQLALTGADLAARLNGQPVPRYQTVPVAAGATLTFGRLVAGCRAYLAVGGAWQVPLWLGSRSALPSAPAATPDSLIRKDSSLRIQGQVFIAPRTAPARLVPALPPHLRVRVLPGPEFGEFSVLSIGYFLSRAYQLTPEASRMGYRLRGPAPAELRLPGRELISSGIVPGTVQVTSAGQPVLLLADAQTTGGYYRLATVISADLDAVAQLKPGDTLAFALVGPEEAQAALLARRRQWAALAPGRTEDW